VVQDNITICGLLNNIIMAFLIIKKVTGVIGEQILIYPAREGDEIFYFMKLTDAEQKLNEIKGNAIYSDCVLQIIEDFEWLSLT
jgi:hypothetical protein